MENVRHINSSANCSISAVAMATLLFSFVVQYTNIFDGENGDIANTAKEDKTDNYG